MNLQPGGKLCLTISEANLTRDTEWIGKMSPYVIFSYKGKEFKTKASKREGKHPQWNE